MALRKRQKYSFGEGVTYETYINSPVGKLRDDFLNRVLDDLGFSTPENWSRSEFEPEALFDALKTYDNPARYTDVGQVGQKVLRTAYGTVRNRYAHLVGTLTVRSAWEVTRTLKPEKSSGAPFFARKGEILEEAILRCQNIADGIVAPDPCVAYYRTQNRLIITDETVTPNPKVRLVWGYPVAMTIMEGMFAQPAIQAVKADKGHPITTGRGKAEIGAMVASFSWEPVVISCDWSRFDATVPAYLVSWAFDIIGSWFQADHFALFKPEWEVIKRFFLTTPIVMPDGYVWAGKRNGIPSGSYFTSLIGSLVNQILIEYLSNEAGTGTTKLLVLGDDSLIGYVNKPDTGYMRELASHLGMSLTVVGANFRRRKRQPFHYLGHTWNRGRPVRPLEETVQRIVHLERNNHKAVKETGARRYRYEKLMSMYGDNVDAWLLVRRLVYESGVGTVHQLGGFQRVVNRAAMEQWDWQPTVTESPICLLTFK